MTTTLDAPAPASSQITTASPVTTSATGAAESVRRVSRFRRRAMAVTIGVGAALTFAGFAATNWEGSFETAAYLDSLAEKPTQSQIAAVLLHFGYMGFLPMLLALGMFARRRAVKLGHVGLGIGLLGALSLPGLLVTDFYDLAIRQSLPLDQAVAVSEKSQSYGWALAIGGPIVMAVFVGMLLLIIAAARARFLGWWTIALLPVGVVVSATPALIPALIGSGLIALAMIVVAARVWNTTDEEWATSVPAGL